MKIGDLSTQASTPVETIRFYEREGLLPKPERTQGNFRIYQKNHLVRLQLIRHCRVLDMSLDEIRVLLRVKDAPGSACGEVNALLDEHICHVSRRIKELKRLFYGGCELTLQSGVKLTLSRRYRDKLHRLGIT